MQNVTLKNIKRPFMSNQQSFRRADVVSNGLILFRVQEFMAHNKNKHYKYIMKVLSKIILISLTAEESKEIPVEILLI